MERNIILFDVETTGLKNTDEVIQFSAIVVHQIDNQIKVKNVISFYCDTNIIISPEASKVNGITNSMLKELSGGKYFEEQICKYPEIVSPSIQTVFVSYGIDFDTRLVNQTLSQNGYDRINFGRKFSNIPRSGDGISCFCLLELCRQIYGRGTRLKLQYVMQHHIKTNLLDSLYFKMKKEFNIPSSALDGFHDSLYDSVACLAIFIHNRLHLAY
ncbi:3'-5' exonuclease [uncultured Clostridium sp.]|uniref:3'-5' exonuclease n=1 Tax=uncultured Clostridium sp. TaxID=59620 RepID=UPI0026F3807E|nr:3'-5' exonuclease [uncultured Clostridium sp.]